MFALEILLKSGCCTGETLRKCKISYKVNSLTAPQLSSRVWRGNTRFITGGVEESPLGDHKVTFSAQFHKVFSGTSRTSQCFSLGVSLSVSADFHQFENSLSDWRQFWKRELQTTTAQYIWWKVHTTNTDLMCLVCRLPVAYDAHCCICVTGLFCLVPTAGILQANARWRTITSCPKLLPSFFCWFYLPLCLLQGALTTTPWPNWT